MELPDLKNFKKYKEIKIKTKFGYPSSSLEFFNFLNKKIAFLNRHGKKLQFSPAKINYRANISALEKIGVKYIFSFNSVGSLKKKIRPKTFLIPSDYIDFDPPTFYEKYPEFTIPSISQHLRRILIKSLKKLKLQFYEKGTYFNSKGPRLETKAEINLIKNFADVVGMEMAKEATLAKELGLEYSSVCSVDNYANGIGKKPLNIEEITQQQNKDKEFFEKIIAEIIKLNLK